MTHVVVHNYFKRTRDANSSIGLAIERARKIDPLQYLRGLKKIYLVPDRDNWNAKYDPEEDEIILERKFTDKTFLDQVQTLLHEAAHRGQAKDKKTYEEFKRLGLNQLAYFKTMANPAHRKDYARKGIDNVAEEVFAESYARFALKMEMPTPLRNFWQERTQ